MQSFLSLMIIRTNYCFYDQKMLFENFDFSTFIIKKGSRSTLMSLYLVAATFLTSKSLEHTTKKLEIGKSHVLRKCALMHIILKIMITMLIIIT